MKKVSNKKGEKINMKRILFIGSASVLLIAVLLIVLTFASGSKPIISSVDGVAVSGGEVEVSSQTPTFSGIAEPGALVNIYNRTSGGDSGPLIDKVAIEDDLSLAFQPGNPNPGPLTDTFDTLNSDIWTAEGNTYIDSGILVTNISGSGSSANITLNPDYQFDLLSSSKPLFAEVELTVNEVDGSGYRIPFSIDENSNNKGMAISIGDYGIGYDINDEIIPGGTHNNITSVIPTIGQKIKLRIEIDNPGQARLMADTNFDGSFDAISQWENFTIWGGPTRIHIGVQNGPNTGNVSVSWDNLVTNFSLPPISEGYLMSRTGMEFDGNSYMDDLGAFGTPGVIGVFVLGGDGPVFPPAYLPSDVTQFDAIYVYLVSIDLGEGQAHRTTWYSVEDPIGFYNTISNFGIPPFSVVAFAQAFTNDGNGSFIPTGLPVVSEGSIDNSGAVLPPGVSYSGILVASAVTDPGGSWSAMFGKDENGAQIDDIDNLNGLGSSPYSLVAKSGGEESDVVIVNLVVTPVAISLVDGVAPDASGLVPETVSSTPTFTGTAPADLLVSVYDVQAFGEAPELEKVSGESDLSIQYNSGADTYYFERTGISIDGVSYTDSLEPMGLPAGPGVMWAGSQQGDLLPAELSSNSFWVIDFTDWSTTEENGDVYVYAVAFEMPDGSSLRFTIYDVKTPEVFAAWTVPMFNSFVSEGGGSFSVKGHAKAFTAGPNNTFIPESLPLENQGIMVFNPSILNPITGEMGSGEILPATAITETLIATATANQNNIWMVQSNVNMLDLHDPSYKVIAKTDDGKRSDAVIFNVELPANDVIAPVTTAEITGTAEESPYGSWYKDSATVALNATDEQTEGQSSGVAATYYSLSGATNQGLLTYYAPIAIYSEGETIVAFYSVDNAGNIENTKTVSVKIDKDGDYDGIYNNFDKCPTLYGSATFEGCPNAISTSGDLHIVYSGKDSGYAGIVNGKQKNSVKIPLQPGPVGDSMQENIDSVRAKVYSLSALQSQLGATGFDKKLKTQCDSVFDSTIGINEGSLGNTDFIGVPGVGDYVLAVRTVISEPTDSIARFATVCRRIDSNRFGASTKIAEQKIKFMKTVRNNCDSKDPKKICIQLDPGNENVITGSMLSITSPEEARWEDGLESYVYPYIFESDSDWSIDVCSYVPVGYEVAGVYNENGDIIATSDCSQTLVSGEMKVLAFEIVDIGSPSVFDVTTSLNIRHKDEATGKEKKEKIDLKIGTSKVSMDKISKKSITYSLQNINQDISEPKEIKKIAKEEESIITKVINYVGDVIERIRGKKR